jgi:tetratricopeptide (TPR) repeat protein
MTALAAVYESMGQHDKALALTQQAAAADPGNALAQFNRGVFLLNANQNTEAISAFEAALAVNPGLVESHFLLGTLFLGQNNVPKAIEHLEAYVAANPKNEQNVATAKGLIAALKKK